MEAAKFLSVSSSATKEQRKENFENYWEFTQQHGGEPFEDDKDLAKKRARLKYFQDNPVKLRKSLADPDAFYRNYVNMKDDPKSLDRMTLMLMGMYKFARHEWMPLYPVKEWIYEQFSKFPGFLMDTPAFVTER
ncbi:MAG: hypothetical protein ACXWTL_08840 [Methylobacter sp.]